MTTLQNRRRKWRGLLLFLGACWMLPAAPALGYQQTMTCDASGQYACRRGERPLPVRWPGAQAGYVINERGTQNSDAPRGFSPELEAVVTSSFDQWNQVRCPGAPAHDACSDMLLIYEGTTRNDVVEFNQRNLNANMNLVIWRDTGWDQVASSMTFALTSVTYNPQTGQIVDADIEINSENYMLNVIDPVERNYADLKNTLVHEVGHFIGLDHSHLRGATMYPNAGLGETSKRVLHDDDIEGLCASYPPSFVPRRTCDNPYIDPNPDPNPNSGAGGGVLPPRNQRGDDDPFRCSVGGQAAPTMLGWLLGLGVFLTGRRIWPRVRRS